MAAMLRQMRNTVLRTVAAGTVAVGVVEVTTHLPSEGRSSQFYHSLCDDVVTPLMRSTLDPERAHHYALEFAKRGWSPTFRPSAVEYSVKISSEPLGGGLVFGNCIGLAAGFDKDGEVIQPMLDMGFGFIEVGSVTPEPQPGNPKPRMFRLTEDLGVINRYGFNSMGADVVEQHLRHYRNPPIVEEESESESALEKLNSLIKFTVSLVRPAPREQPQGVVGVNLGKNKDSEDEIADYERGIRQLGPFADYLVINVSSPNTPGLRDLQQPDPLKRILEAAVRTRNELPIIERNGKFHVPPLLIKLAPDMDEAQLEQAVHAVMQSGIDGIIVTNTTLSRPSSVVSKQKHEEGGLSGAPVRDMSTECIRKVYAMTDGNIPIIGVGGVGSGHDAYEKLKAGASLVQVYSMMVYEGPGVVSRIRKELAELMIQNGQRRMEDIVGLDHEEIYWKKREGRLLEKQRQETVLLEDERLTTFTSSSGVNKEPVWDDTVANISDKQQDSNTQPGTDNGNSVPPFEPPLLESSGDE